MNTDWILPALLTVSAGGNLAIVLLVVKAYRQAEDAALPYPQPGEGPTTVAPITDHAGKVVAHGMFQTDGQLNSVHMPDSWAIVSPAEAKELLGCEGFQTVGSIHADGVRIDSCTAIAPVSAGVRAAARPLVGSSS